MFLLTPSACNASFSSGACILFASKRTAMWGPSFSLLTRAQNASTAALSTFSLCGFVALSKSHQNKPELIILPNSF